MIFLMALIRRFGLGIAAAVFCYYISLLYFPAGDVVHPVENGTRVGLTIGAALLGFFLPRTVAK